MLDLTGFADNASPGTAVSRQLGLVSPMTEHVRAVFGKASGLRSSWTFIGVAGFLVWGVPMSMTIAGIFAKAWRREQLGWVARLGRGAQQAGGDDAAAARRRGRGGLQ